MLNYSTDNVSTIFPVLDTPLYMYYTSVFLCISVFDWFVYVHRYFSLFDFPDVSRLSSCCRIYVFFKISIRFCISIFVKAPFDSCLHLPLLYLCVSLHLHVNNDKSSGEKKPLGFSGVPPLRYYELFL